MTQEQINELRKLAEAATPGPWEYDYDDQDHDTCIGILWGTNHYAIATIPYNGQVSDEKVTATGNYIAAANPAAVLELIAEVEALRANATGLEHQLRESRQNDYHAMSYLADCRFAVGDDGKRMLPEFVEYLKALKQQRDELLSALKEARELVDDWGAYAPAYMQEKHDLKGDLERLDALLQPRAVKDSLTTQADCRACVNRGRVNGLSQESYCDSCVYEGRGWRQNHFVDAVADRLLEGGE